MLRQTDKDKDAKGAPGKTQDKAPTARRNHPGAGKPAAARTPRRQSLQQAKAASRRERGRADSSRRPAEFPRRSARAMNSSLQDRMQVPRVAKIRQLVRG